MEASAPWIAQSGVVFAFRVGPGSSGILKVAPPSDLAVKWICNKTSIGLAGRGLHRYTHAMADAQRFTHTSAMVLQAVSAGHIYGYTVIEATGLPSGTVYPALRRMERDELIRSRWERQSIADAELRPPRKYYRLTPAGEAMLEVLRKRYPLLANLVRTGEVEGR